MLSSEKEETTDLTRYKSIGRDRLFTGLQVLVTTKDVGTKTSFYNVEIKVKENI